MRCSSLSNKLPNWVTWRDDLCVMFCGIYQSEIKSRSEDKEERMKLTESITTRNNLPLFTLILHKQNDKRNKNIYVYEHFGLRHMSCLGIRVKDHLHFNTCIWMVLVIFQLSSMISDTNMDQRGFFALHEEAYQKQRPYKHCLGG